MTTRVDTRVSFVRNSREIHAKRVSYFVKKGPCFAKLALECKIQFRMFRISRNKTFNKQNETKLKRRMKKTVLRSRSQSGWSLNYLRPQSLFSCIPPVLNPSSPESLLYFISSCLHPSCPVSFLYCIHRLISRDRPTKTGRLCLCSPFFYVAALNVCI